MENNIHPSEEIVPGMNGYKQNNFESRLAVNVQNVVFCYKKKVRIIDEISIKIPKGKIYALLGSNGSGKTTLLRIVLGRLKPKSGYIRVFGVESSSKQSDIPGPGVGYMPQDISLFNELTIEETLIYYGILYHMKSNDIQLRIKDLTELLNLPEKQRKISELSGGQERLVSIAVTMIHRPRLLILDEPTVGVDSLLRFRIWQYLENICKNDGITVIITTHYIEEAKSASNVAFIESGKLLAQSNPNELLVKHNCKTLEDVFLKLCLQNTQEKQNRNTMRMKTEKFIANSHSVRNYSHIEVKQKIIDYHHMKALLWKCYIRVKRNPLALLLFYMIPVLQIIFLSICIGNKILNLPVAVYNAEINPELSNLYIDKIVKNNIKCNIYDNIESAVDSVKRGKNWIAMSFAENFTDSFEARILDPLALTDDEIGFSEIKLYSDISNYAIHITLNRTILESFQEFMQNFSSTLGYNPHYFSLPINYQKTIYGSTEFSFNKYLSPAIALSTLHALPMISATLLVIFEKKSGHLERAYVSGIKPIEFLLSQMIQVFSATLAQVSLSLFLLIYIFDTKVEGSVLEVFILSVLQALQGMTFGFLISIICSQAVTASIIVFALILPLWLSSGIIWPLEAIPGSLRAVLFWTPLTQPTESMRSIMLRGWSISNSKVQLGFAVSLTYTLIVSFINIFLINIY